jgi:pyruvate dehydrogenase (quinone)
VRAETNALSQLQSLDVRRAHIEPIGFSSGYAAMHACDMLLMLGTDFPYKQFFPADCQIAQIDIRPENLGRRCKLDLGLVGDVGLTIGRSTL